MKLLIASDLHGSTPCCEALLSRFEAEGADRLLFLGDLLYHGPRNDLSEGYRPKGVIPLLNGVKDKLLCVRGNCDAEVDQMVLEFPIMADYLLLELDSHRIFATHGHVYNRDNPPPVCSGFSNSQCDHIPVSKRRALPERNSGGFKPRFPFPNFLRNPLRHHVNRVKRRFRQF